VNYIPPEPPPRRFVYRTPEEQRADQAKFSAACEASWRGVNELQIRRKIRDLEGHPFRPILGRMLATALRRHAPSMLSQLPPEFLEPTP
jgi:hypothetical protein